jgi:hypothetical protein
LSGAAGGLCNNVFVNVNDSRVAMVTQFLHHGETQENDAPRLFYGEPVLVHNAEARKSMSWRPDLQTGRHTVLFAWRFRSKLMLKKQTITPGEIP